MKRSIIILAALVAAACNNKPTSFGIDVEARTSMLSSSVRNSIVSARLLVSGAETFMKDIGGVGKAAQSGSFKFRYVPGVHSGSLTIRVDGVDANGATVAGGTAPPVTIADGKAVDAVLTLAVNGNGVACMAGTDCMSGNCADGVCCDMPCNGVCEQCNVPGSEGVCTAAMMGTDPDNDCAAKVQPAPDGGIVDGDGGTDGDGGVAVGPDMAGSTPAMANPQMCAGTCNGARACTFPGATTNCGPSFCSARASVGTLFCDGNGTCNATDSNCTDYVCASGACKTSCNSDADCQAADFCNLNINKCVPKHDLGVACTGVDQCKSGFCASGVCCDSACNDPSGVQSCVNPGPAGHCKCTGTTCDSGVSCVLWYKDGDRDGYGDSGGTIGNNGAMAGCASGSNSTPPTMPTAFVTNNNDCDDGDANANPAQTNYYGTPSLGKGTFDYNCDGVIEKGVAEDVGGSCVFCYTSGSTFCARNSGCSTAGNGSTTGCIGLLRPPPFPPICFGSGSGAYFATVNCGATATFTNCGTCSAAGGGPNNTTSSVQQTCH